MKKVILTIGPRGAGKSTLCQEVLARRSDVALIERDAILRELFGATMLSPYQGEHAYAAQVLFERVGILLQRENAILILDMWNGFAQERVMIAKLLRGLGADEIEGWHFVTSEDLVVRQFLAREQPTKLSRRAVEEGCRRDYRLFHRQHVELSQGFDAITVIDPAQLALFSWADILLPPRPHN